MFGRDFLILRLFNIGLVFKEVVVLVYNSNRFDDFFSKVFKNIMDVFLLIIFVLVRSRWENVERLEKYWSCLVEGCFEYKYGFIENLGLRID